MLIVARESLCKSLARVGARDIFGADTNIVIVSIGQHAVEIRKEESFEIPCSTEEPPSTRPRTIQITSSGPMRFMTAIFT